MMVQVNVTLTQTIKKLLEEKKYSTLRDILITMMPYDIAAVFEELQDEKMAILFRILPKELAAETFVEMDENTQQFFIFFFSDSELKEVVDELFVDDAVDLIEEMPANVVKRILRSADKDMRKQINELLQFLFVGRERENDGDTARLTDPIHIAGKHPDTVLLIIP